MIVLQSAVNEVAFEALYNALIDEHTVCAYGKCFAITSQAKAAFNEGKNGRNGEELTSVLFAAI